ncbi:spermine/spermidine synthase domain-containing protein [Hydrogenimonas sp.]
MINYEQPSNASDKVVRGIERIVATGKTPYQDYFFFENRANGLCIAINGDIQSCQSDENIYHEALVHPAMILHPAPRNVLIMGGGEGATAREVLKHDAVVEKCVMVDIDEEFVEVCRRYAPTWGEGAFGHEKLDVHYMDINEYIKTCDLKFDVVIGDLVDVEDWESFLANLYSDEFYANLKKILNPGAILATQAGALNSVDVTNHRNVRRGLGAVFGHIESYGIVVPSFYGLWGYVLASDTPFDVGYETLSTRILSRFEERGIELDAIGNDAFHALFGIPLSIRKKFEGE